jgi:predicted enzyme related to lactoylglutathione lyase
MNRLIHFEIHASDPDRSAKFYGDLFGWDIREWSIPGVEVPPENRYLVVTTGPQTEPGINGGILVRRGAPPADGQPVNAFVCTIGVADVNQSVARAEALGGTIALPRMPVKGIGWLAYCKDPHGNIFGMMQEDRNAG